MINALTTGMDPTGLYLCKQKDLHVRLECQSYTLDVMTQRMRSQSIWPLPNAEDIVETPQDFGPRIEKAIWADFALLHNECNIQTWLLNARQVRTWVYTPLHKNQSSKPCSIEQGISVGLTPVSASMIVSFTTIPAVIMTVKMRNKLGWIPLITLVL